MKDTLASIFQQRMDKCQSEKVWAAASLAAMNAFVLAEKETFLDHVSREAMLTTIGILSLITYLFVLYRTYNYYEFRNDLAGLLAKEKETNENLVPAYMTEKRHLLSRNGSLWVIIYAIVVFLPFVAQIYCFKR